MPQLRTGAGLALLNPSTRKLSYIQALLALFSGGFISLWPGNEGVGTSLKDASGNGYNGTIVSLSDNSVPFLNGDKSWFYSGSGYANISLVRTVLNPNEGAIGIWVKPDMTMFTDATAHRFIGFRVDGNNAIWIGVNTAGKIENYRYAGGVGKGIAEDPPLTNDWILKVISWSVTTGLVEVYTNDVLVYSAAPSGTWAGTPAAANSLLGAFSTTPSQPTKGNIGPTFILNRPVTANEVSIIASLVGKGSYAGPNWYVAP